MFSKFEFFGAIIVSMMGGIAIGYFKAQFDCLLEIMSTIKRKRIRCESKES